jgi:hypothetical protein
LRRAIVLVAAVVIGVLAGREIAYERSLPGLSGVLGGIIPMFLLGVAIVGLLAVALVATLIRRGHVSRAVVTLVATAGMLTSGAFGGAASAGATGAVHREPVVLQAAGEAHVELDGVRLPFDAVDRSPVECESVPDGVAVAAVTASALGELGPATLRASVSVPALGPGASRADFWIDAGDLADGATQPYWSGSVLVLEMARDGTSGRLAFDGLAHPIDEKLPPADASWPATISGQLSWSCQPW